LPGVTKFVSPLHPPGLCAEPMRRLLVVLVLVAKRPHDFRQRLRHATQTQLVAWTKGQRAGGAGRSRLGSDGIVAERSARASGRAARWLATRWRMSPFPGRVAP
jgi:hypothetical protein